MDNCVYVWERNNFWRYDLFFVFLVRNSQARHSFPSKYYGCDTIKSNENIDLMRL